ncbi:MAG: cobalamin-binding protein [Zoogloea sp.]|uniref:cobalamin-binding protein n=1 Tax=Zoogloea sp. TaxID=49181 RepID=UPI0026085979|nr:cobalamin-binding protein [Zoogloea sp.]MDD3329348.1 cobalamin-binding protein [Zoogloea sp.]
MPRLPQRIVCLSTETVEVLYLLGEEARIAGISGFTTHPPRARKEKPKVSGFSSARLERILAVEPDLVLAFSDLQAETARDLVKAGVAVHVFNHRSVDGILAMIETVGRLVGAEQNALALVADLEAHLDRIRAQGEARVARLGRRPRVYFEEWNEPLITGIRWVSELIQIAGGEDCFGELAIHPNAKDRILADPAVVIPRAPELIIGSWCGKHFQPGHVTARPGWDGIPAVRNGQVREIKSAILLAPGPAALREGLPAIAACLDQLPA